MVISVAWNSIVLTTLHADSEYVGEYNKVAIVNFPAYTHIIW